MAGFENVLEERNQQKRIEIVLTDAYGEYEQMEAFLCYLDEYLSFPFQATIKNEPISVEFTVLGFTSLEPNRVVCKIKINGVISRTPLTEIEPIEQTNHNFLIISDYLVFLGIE